MSTRRPKVPRPAQVAVKRAAVPAVSAARKTAGTGATAGTARGAEGGRPESGRPQAKSPGKSPAQGPAQRPAKEHATPRRAGERKATPSEVRAAERSHLAGEIRRASVPYRRKTGKAIVPAEDATPIPAKSFSGRLLALGVVVLTIMVLLAPSVRTYLQQQGEMDALRTEISRLEDAKADKTRQLARWEDPAYIKQQARDRLFLVMPGEKRYLVKGETGFSSSTDQGSSAAAQNLPWVDSLLDSVTRAATDG